MKSGFGGRTCWGRKQRDRKRAEVKRAKMERAEMERAEVRYAVPWIWCMLLAVSICFLGNGTAYGDVIWTPNDSFYEEHYEDCEYVGRRYYANGSNGYVTVMEQPDTGKIIDHSANGAVFYVSMTYDTGRSGTWGVVQYRMDENGSPVMDYGWEDGAAVGWIPMTDLLVVYDGQSFREEHKGELQETDQESMPRVEMPEQGIIYLWQYPGAEDWYNELKIMESDMQFDMIYKDPNGDLWGYCGYYYGNRDFWVNLSDPGQDKGGLGQPEEPTLIQAVSQEELQALPKTGRAEYGLLLPVAGMIILTVALTASLIYVMTRKKGRT